MRVLFVTHDYLPAHSAGTEVHTAELARGLRELGVETELFTTEKDVSRPNLSVTIRDWDGTRVHEVVNNLFYRRFEETYDYPAVVEVFRRVLDEVRPEVVHFMHLLYLSAGCVEEVRRREIPCLFTLHDFWLTCARFGQRVHADGGVCHEIDFARCGTCLARTKIAQTPLERRVARVLTGLRSTTGIDIKGVARGLAARVRTANPPGGDDVPTEVAREYEAHARRRTTALRERVVPAVDLFVAPSRFLAEELVRWGIPPERVEHAPNRIDLAPFQGFRRTPDPGGKLRVAFLGTLAPHKAPHVLLEAWGLVPTELRTRASLRVFGPRTHFPEYVEQLGRQAREVGAELAGSLERREIPRAFESIDVLVVPSVWFENMPLTLLEARATRTPAIASDLGGMRELVEEGRTGWRFPPGNARALAEILAGLLREPARLEALDFGAGEPGSDDYARAMLARYEALVRARGDA